MKKMNIGLVGAGFMGKAHMVAFSNMPKLFTDAPFIPVYACSLTVLCCHGRQHKS